MTPKEAAQLLKQKFGAAVSEPTEFRAEITLAVAREQIVPICQFLKADPRTSFEMITDISGVDNYGEDPRFEVVYLLYSLKNRCWLRLKVKVSEDDLTVDSVTGVWRGADWHEREAFDMFGIKFRGHPNLKRILMWEGYPHFPLRKDFPLAGIPAELPGSEVMPQEYKDAETAPMLGGPFVPGTGTALSKRREPRQKDTVIEKSVTQEKGSLPGGVD
jgi:NADH-quinone oxidoreductase subunit C